MPDITMCKGDGCPLKEHCHRYKATPDELYQSYFTYPPFQTIPGGEIKCDHEWNRENHLRELTK